MASAKPKIILFSHALYNKASYNELSQHETGSLNANHKLTLTEEYYDALSKFYAMSLEDQRKALASPVDEKRIVEAHVIAIVKLDSVKEVLTYALPSLDGILFGICEIDDREANRSSAHLRSG